MKITDIFETTTSGSVATVAKPMGKAQSRNGVGKGIYPGVKGGDLLTGKPSNKKFANSVKESKQIEEAHLEEDDLIIVPGQGRSRKTGLIKHGESRLDHEVEMAKSDLFSAAKNAKQVYELIADVSEEEGLEGWVQEKIIKANDYLNTIREYLEGKQLQQHEMTGGVIAGGISAESNTNESKGQVPTHRSLNVMSNDKVKIPAGSEFRQVEGSNKLFVHLINGSPEGVYRIDMKMLEPINNRHMAEGAKVDRMVKHIEKSERGLGKSKEKASDIAWATANKRGMLDNRNKKG
jgi:hypothetical protein